MLRKVEADTAFRMSGSVKDGAGEAASAVLSTGSDGDGLAVVQGIVWWGNFRGGDAQPACLRVHHFDQGDIKLVVEDGRAGKLLEALRSGNVVDVGVGDDDLLEAELVLFEELHDPRDVVAGIDDDGFVGGLVAQDGAVALERADYQDFVDHVSKSNGLSSICDVIDKNRVIKRKMRRPEGLRTS